MSRPFMRSLLFATHAHLYWAFLASADQCKFSERKVVIWLVAYIYN